MSEDAFRWGLLGPGRIAHRFAKGLHAIPDAVLHGVASTRLERAREFAGTHGASTSYGSYEDLVGDEAIDGVYIATPHPFHFENARLCLEAGKPVLCEKPLTVNRDQSRDLIRLARDEKLFLMEALWSRYLPIYRRIREWLDAGRIGNIRLITSTFGVRMPYREEDRTYNEQLAGGALLDIGIYPIALSQWILRRNPIDFAAQAEFAPTGVDASTAATLRFDGGVLSQFVACFTTSAVNDLLIYGTEGHIRIHPRFWEATKATLKTPNELLEIEAPFRASGFEYETEEAMRCIREGRLESPEMTHGDTLANMRLMDEIRAEIGLRYSFE